MDQWDLNVRTFSLNDKTPAGRLRLCLRSGGGSYSVCAKPIPVAKTGGGGGGADGVMVAERACPVLALVVS